ncbi:hypothetical protein FHX44_111478 [Pseudonocardia hierapolitana]|uniref:NurA domain-containing protein n=1 Tax=Pseudonocardia hierapolitana TaxID=1128676 RepID=A0A561SL47_9PSEU|nr:hypothetical protein [Pseudonocardia hierapolitana]TWF75594.1 hypothetical protein FHX44_111478 [Pseudonocardia hierapolitana]
MKFAVDPWDPSYGTSLDTELGESAAQVALDVELPAAEWRPIDPDPAVLPPDAVLFVDGVRRVDAQLWVEDGSPEASPALCASYAAGVVCCCREGGAHLLTADVRRGLFTTAESADDVRTTAGTYRATRTAAHPDVAPAQLLSLAVQRELADTELAAAAAARSGHGVADDLLVVDGPLRGRQHLPRVIGFVKTHRSDYLPPQLGGVVASLRTGQRTPVFRLGSSWERHTWYLRLPCRPGAPWAGIVRVECSSDLPAAEAVAHAARSQATLPRFASTEYKDSRAPQNLYPIAGLERELRRRLGEPNLLYRALRKAAAA